jgi:hypothetical protein
MHCVHGDCGRWRVWAHAGIANHHTHVITTGSKDMAVGCWLKANTFDDAVMVLIARTTTVKSYMNYFTIQNTSSTILSLKSIMSISDINIYIYIGCVLSTGMIEQSHTAGKGEGGVCFIRY